MRRTITLPKTLHLMIAAPFLLAALPVSAEEPAPVVSYVSGLAPDDLLNIRASPSAIGKTEARLPVGSPLKNFGCADVNGNPWCKVEEVDNPQIRGWAPARYLNPASAVVLTEANMAFSAQPNSAATTPPPDLTARLGADQTTEPHGAPKSAEAIGRTAMQDAYGLAFATVETASTGDGTASGIPCARNVGQPMTRCEISVAHTGGDSAVTVTWPDGGTRIISFHGGLPTGSDSSDEFRFTREGSLNMIRVGVSERFEITDALATGG
ncbi:SH3 domain-containing protein [Mesorhizobium waimense]|uniref:SH3 domain-containing protein n=1 Tax=Mesorhizobium waimense TaxID=1300307 RepID=A0A3A5KSN5_9HYPH|nr:SH3 domain-containing protein [Mesorhizobium waimense]RJT39234.1 SH3 domain-containing protein [Mesorhizobium waimense]